MEHLYQVSDDIIWMSGLHEWTYAYGQAHDKVKAWHELHSHDLFSISRQHDRITYHSLQSYHILYIGRAPIIIPEDADINRIVDTIVTTRKQNPTAESVESIWSILDANDDGKVK